MKKSHWIFANIRLSDNNNKLKVVYHHSILILPSVSSSYFSSYCYLFLASKKKHSDLFVSGWYLKIFLFLLIFARESPLNQDRLWLCEQKKKKIQNLQYILSVCGSLTEDKRHNCRCLTMMMIIIIGDDGPLDKITTQPAFLTKLIHSFFIFYFESLLPNLFCCRYFHS